MTTKRKGIAGCCILFTVLVIVVVGFFTVFPEDARNAILTWIGLLTALVAFMGLFSKAFQWVEEWFEASVAAEKARERRQAAEARHALTHSQTTSGQDADRRAKGIADAEQDGQTLADW